MTTRLSTPGYRLLRDAYNATFDGHDPWGSNIAWLFAVAEFLTHEGNGAPEGWDFRDSPLHQGWAPEGYPDEILAELAEDRLFTVADAELFGEVLSRYDAILRSAGRDY